MPSGQKKTYGVNTVLSDRIPVREGYDFQGWSETEDDELMTTRFMPGDTWIKDENVVLHAVWSLKKYNIHYEANAGGSDVKNIPSDQTKVHGENLSLYKNIPTRDGYNFKGWGTSNADQSASYQPGDDFEKNDKTTLYALWENKTYTVTYDPNDDGEGTAVPGDQILKYNDVGVKTINKFAPIPIVP